MVNIPKLGTRIPRKGILMLILPALFLSGCSCFTVKNDAPCPERPELAVITEDLQIQMPPDAVFLVAENMLLLKKYAKELEVRAGCGESR